MAVVDHVAFEMTACDFCYNVNLMISFYNRTMVISLYLKLPKGTAIFQYLNFHDDAF